MSFYFKFCLWHFIFIYEMEKIDFTFMCVFFFKLMFSSSWCNLNESFFFNRDFLMDPLKEDTSVLSLILSFYINYLLLTNRYFKT